jgi:hypothetical protein
MYRTSKAHDKTDFLGHGKGPNYSIAATYKGERIFFFREGNHPCMAAAHLEAPGGQEQPEAGRAAQPVRKGGGGLG